MDGLEGTPDNVENLARREESPILVSPWPPTPSGSLPLQDSICLSGKWEGV